MNQFLDLANQLSPDGVCTNLPEHILVRIKFYLQLSLFDFSFSPNILEKVSLKNNQEMNN